MRSLNDIHLDRGRLLERVTTQRYILIAEVQPVRRSCERADSILDHVRAGVDYIKRYPAVAGVMVAVIMTFNIRRVWRIARRGFVVWRAWRTVWERLTLVGWPGFR